MSIPASAIPVKKPTINLLIAHLSISSNANSGISAVFVATILPGFQHEKSIAPANGTTAQVLERSSLIRHLDSSSEAFLFSNSPVRQRNQQKKRRESRDRVLQALDKKRARGDPHKSDDAQPCRIRKEPQVQGKMGNSIGTKRTPKRKMGHQN